MTPQDVFHHLVPDITVTALLFSTFSYLILIFSVREEPVLIFASINFYINIAFLGMRLGEELFPFQQSTGLSFFTLCFQLFLFVASKILLHQERKESFFRFFVAFLLSILVLETFTKFIFDEPKAKILVILIVMALTILFLDFLISFFQ